jgi:hypothetical protein
MRIQALLMAAVALTGCKPDDVDGKTGDTAAPTETDTDTDTDADSDADADADTDTDTDTQIDPADAILGDWVSEGDDVSPLFELFYLVRIDATFSSDGTYSVDSLDASGASVNYTGTYTVAVDTTPHTIVLEQTTPSIATASGIWEVAGDGVLSYEVVQTVPDIGFAPPTPAAGFGSTVGTGISPGDNVQVFRPQ